MTKIDHQCKKCLFVWKTSPHHVKQGNGCPKCAGQYSPTTEEYKEQIKDKPIICIGEYKTAKIKIPHQCKTCDHIWKVSPNSIKQGSGCPKCYGNIKLTTEEYKNQIRDKSVFCVGKYKGALTKIDHECKECGYIWKTKPSSIKCGFGCPRCTTLKSKIERYKGKPTTFYLIQLKDGVKPGLTRTSVHRRYKYDKTVFYEILEEIHFNDGMAAVKLEEEILNETEIYRLYQNKKSGPLISGNTEIRDNESLPFIFDILQSRIYHQKTKEENDI